MSCRMLGWKKYPKNTGTTWSQECHAYPSCNKKLQHGFKCIRGENKAVELFKIQVRSVVLSVPLSDISPPCRIRQQLETLLQYLCTTIGTTADSSVYRGRNQLHPKQTRKRVTHHTSISLCSFHSEQRRRCGVVAYAYMIAILFLKV